MRFLLLLTFSTCFAPAMAQKKSKFSVEINYGLNGNFFVRSYDENGGPQNKTYFYKKKFVGSMGGFQLNYILRNTSALFLGFSQSTNKGTINFDGDINGVNVFIRDFRISHMNQFYQLGYERRFKKSNPLFRYSAGVLLLGMQQQEIGVENFSNQVSLDERNFKNSKLQEAGVFGGLHIVKNIDTRFEAGLRFRLYYLVSTQSWEAITLTPTLTYHF